MSSVFLFCMWIVNHNPYPINLHGCIPSTNWTIEGCDKFSDISPVVITVPGHSQVVIHKANEYEDDDYYTRLWDDGKNVDIHWRDEPCLKL